MKVLPDLNNSEVEEIRVGLRPYSRDDLPILGKVPTTEGVWIATGHGPLGLTTAPITGKLLVQMMNDQETDIDMGSFSPDRFL